MLKRFLYLFIIYIIINPANIFSQQAATVNLTGGYTFPLGALYGKFADDENAPFPNTDQTYYMTYGFNYGINYKQGLGKSRMFRLTGSLNFSIMGQSRDYQDQTIKLSQSFLSIGVGGEWNLAPKRGLLNPFCGAEMDINLFAGNLQIIQPTQTTQLNLNSTIRYGASFGGGVDFQFHQNVGAIVGIKYFLANLFGKKYENATSTTYGLDDAAHSYQGVSYPARSINVFQLYGGFSYYFGK